jgi:transketolase
MTRESRVHARNLVRWAKDRPEAVVFSGDLTGSTEVAEFRDAYPDRFFSLGMAEQNMLSWAGGMAREGFRPFLHTFAVFLVRRPYDQLAMSIAYPHLPVRLVGFLPGITTPGGVTHQAIEDISLMRGLPNMTVFEMGDAADVESVLDLTDAIDGPVYLRMLRGDIPRLFDTPMEFDRARVVTTATSAKTDVCVISSGICTEEAVRATERLLQSGVELEHLHVTTLKPFTDPQIVEAAARSTHVVTFENHARIGGLGSAVAELMAEAGVGVPLTRMSIGDRFAHGASRPYLMDKFNLTADALVKQVEKLLGRSLDITAEELADVEIPVAGHLSDTQLEAL